MKKYIFLASLTLVFVMAMPVLAADVGKTIGAARLRSAPTMSDGNNIILVMPKGATVDIIEKNNGWYELSYAGKTGWTVDWLVSEVAASTMSFETKQGTYIGLGRVRAEPSLSGKIITTLPKGTMVDITSETNGWYSVKSSTGVIGWTADWLIQIVSTPTIPVISTPAIPIFTTQPPTDGTSKNQASVVPSEVDLLALNTHWLEKVNALRRDKGLRELVLDQRWIDTATTYAAYMGETGTMDHSRADGKTMHQWIDTLGLQFTTRNSTGGWKTNYFTENLSRGGSVGTTLGVERLLDRALDYFLAEGPGGAHYNTIFHADWNSVGLGFYFKDTGNGQYQVSEVFHYGSLVL